MKIDPPLQIQHLASEATGKSYMNHARTPFSTDSRTQTQARATQPHKQAHSRQRPPVGYEDHKMRKARCT